MGNSLANLGDYNIARDALKAVGGNWDILYNNIGKTAVAKAAPKIFLKGGITGSAITLGVISAPYLVNKCHCFMKNRKQLIENESALKQEFAKTIEAEFPTEN